MKKLHLVNFFKNKTVGRGETIHCVKPLEFKESLKTSAERKRKEEVLKQITLTSNLVAPEACYHSSCLKHGEAPPPAILKKCKRGRPEEDHVPM